MFQWKPPKLAVYPFQQKPKKWTITRMNECKAIT
jgi:hypothetical protein